MLFIYLTELSDELTSGALLVRELISLLDFYI